MEVAVERPPVKEENRADTKPDMAVIGSGAALPIVFESFQSPQRRTGSSMKQRDEKSGGSLELEAEMGVVRQENERLKTMLSRVVTEYQSLQMHFLDVVKVCEQQQAAASAANNKAANKLLLSDDEPQPPVVANDDELVSLSLGTRAAVRRKGGHERSSSSSGTGGDDDSQLSLGLGFSRNRPSTDDEKAMGPVLNLSSDSSGSGSADEDTTAKPAARKSPSGGDGGGAADDEVQQLAAKKTRVSVRVKCDTPTMNDGCQWRKYGQKISKGNPCPRAYYRCTVAPNCPVRKQVQRCADDKAILITTYEGTHNHQLPPAATAMASTTSAAAAMLTAGSTSSSSSVASLVGRHHLPGGLLGPTTTMVSTTAASCPTITLDLTSPYAAGAAGYESKALPAAWSSGYPAPYGSGGLLSSSYYAKMGSSPAMMMGNLFGGGLGLSSSSRPAEQIFGGQGQSSSYLLQRSAASLGQQSAASVAPVVTDTLAKAITADPGFQSVLAAVITSYMGRGGAGGEAAPHQK